MAVVENSNATTTGEQAMNGVGSSSSSNSLDSNGSSNDLDQTVHHANGGFQSKLQQHLTNLNLKPHSNRDQQLIGGREAEIRRLAELLSKLNPMAEEFVPGSLTNHNNSGYGYSGYDGSASPGFYHHPAANFMMQMQTNDNAAYQFPNSEQPINFRRRRNGYYNKRRINSRTREAQQQDVIRRTVYVSDIDQQITEQQLAALFINCGQVVDCRICGDPNSVLRFAFIEFTDEEGARAALSLQGTMLGFYPVRVLPSKTAIAPVNPTFLPRSEDEREMCARTVYCTNIDKKITQAEVKLFFEQICGTVYRLRLLGDYNHSTRIAFVEFVMAESAIAALSCSGVVLGSTPIRVSPSKTPVRPRPNIR